MGAIWQQAVFGSLPLEIIDGDRSAKYPKRSEFVEAGVPFLNSTNIEAGRFDTTDLNFITDEKAGSIMKGRARPGDIVMTTRGSVGKVALFPHRFPLGIINAQMLIVRSDPERLDQLFLFHLMRGPEFQGRLRSFSSGSAQPQIPIRDLRHIPVVLPPFPTQQRIAAILSAYDDLIENNTRRIAILEEMARRVYEEWFVHFRFPGHEKAEFDGEVPKGWSKRVVADVCSYLNRGLAPKYAEEGVSLVINQKCIRSQKLDLAPARRQTKAIPEDKLVRFGDVLINSTGVGTLGRVAQVYAALGRVTVDTHVTIARPNTDVSVDYFGMAMLGLQSHFEDQGVGSTGQTELSRSRIGETPVMVPSMHLQEKFGSLVAPMRSMCGSLAKKNANLRAQRDMLLPKLISGEIDVSGAEGLLEAAE